MIAFSIAYSLQRHFSIILLTIMKYIALLRGVNAWSKNRVAMNTLKNIFEVSGYTHVRTYVNSGNVIFESDETQEKLQNEIPKKLQNEFGFDIKTLIKNEDEIIKIALSIPRSWKNDAEQRTDVAYLFPEVDWAKTRDELPINSEYIDVRYVKGALIWNVRRRDYNKSKLNAIIRSDAYQYMTVRNANTARYLAGMK